jgi:hypothetical protein
MTKVDELIAAIRALPEEERRRVLDALAQPAPGVPATGSPLVGLFADDPELFERAIKEGRERFNQMFSQTGR